MSVVVGFDDELVVSNAIQIDRCFDHFDVFAEDFDHFLRDESCGHGIADM